MDSNVNDMVLPGGSSAWGAHSPQGEGCGPTMVGDEARRPTFADVNANSMRAWGGAATSGGHGREQTVNKHARALAQSCGIGPEGGDHAANNVRRGDFIAEIAAVRSHNVLLQKYITVLELGKVNKDNRIAELKCNVKELESEVMNLRARKSIVDDSPLAARAVPPLPQELSVPNATPDVHHGYSALGGAGSTEDTWVRRIMNCEQAGPNEAGSVNRFVAHKDNGHSAGSLRTAGQESPAQGPTAETAVRTGHCPGEGSGRPSEESADQAGGTPVVDAHSVSGRTGTFMSGNGLRFQTRLGWGVTRQGKAAVDGRRLDVLSAALDSTVPSVSAAKTGPASRAPAERNAGNGSDVGAVAITPPTHPLGDFWADSSSSPGSSMEQDAVDSALRPPRSEEVPASAVALTPLQQGAPLRSLRADKVQVTGGDLNQGAASPRQQNATLLSSDNEASDGGEVFTLSQGGCMLEESCILNKAMRRFLILFEV